MKKKIIFILLAIFLSGCASSHVYKEVMKEGPAYNTKEFSVSKDILYKAVEKTILSKNFMIEKQDPEDNFILAKRSFQKGKRTIVLLLQGKITTEGENKSTVFLNAIETKEANYVADHTRFFLWIVPLPGGGGKEASRIKEGEEAVKDKKFYQQLLSEITEEIEKVSKN
ncbi:MAG: hypothetical protein WAW67_02065 [Candidatus Omnitrophota bacterium]